MEKETLVSIVLPVAGVRAALDRCVRGVLAQSESRWQLLLAASAETRAWAEAWARRDNRILVQHDDVSGRAAALRDGLAACRGMFTVFLDTEHVWASDFLALTTAFLTCNPLEDMVAMEVHSVAGCAVMQARPTLFREQGRLASFMAADVGRLRDATWHRGELARHLRWGEYTRLAVTLLRTEYAGLLAPALYEESAALDYRLQARLASKSAVNFLALSGGTHHPEPASAEQLRQRELAALAVFDEIHRRQWETDPQLARLRRERIARAERRMPWQALATLYRTLLPRVPPQSRPMATDLGGQPADHSI